jgi:hypothetical protein
MTMFCKDCRSPMQGLIIHRNLVLWCDPCSKELDHVRSTLRGMEEVVYRFAVLRNDAADVVAALAADPPA